MNKLNNTKHDKLIQLYTGSCDFKMKFNNIKKKEVRKLNIAKKYFTHLNRFSDIRPLTIEWIDFVNKSNKKLGNRYLTILPILKKPDSILASESTRLGLFDVYLRTNKFKDLYFVSYTPEQFISLISNGFDVFDLIESGQAIDKATIKLKKKKC